MKERIDPGPLVRAAAAAAVYTVLTVLFAPVSFGPLQLRISETLTILPVLSPSFVPGIAVGCFLSSVLCGAPLPDVVFGSLASLLGAVLTRYFRRRKFLAALMPVLTNSLILPPVFLFAYGIKKAYPAVLLEIMLSELLAAFAGGLLLLRLFKKAFRIIDRTAG